MIAFVLGLAAYVGGYLIKASTPTEFVALLGDLLYTFGWALWTGVVIAVFLQVLPDTKRRQITRWLDAYEAVQRGKTRAARAPTSTDQGAPPAL